MSKLSNQKLVMLLIKRITGQENALLIPRVFVDYIAFLDRDKRRSSLEGALFLSQLLFWSDKGHDPNGWVYKTYKEWEQHLCLSEYQVRKQVNVLAKAGLLETKVKKANGSPTVHYRLKYGEFSDSFLEFLQDRNQRNFSIETKETKVSITETTAETTAETTKQVLRKKTLSTRLEKKRKTTPRKSGLNGKVASPNGNTSPLETLEDSAAFAAMIEGLV